VPATTARKLDTLTTLRRSRTLGTLRNRKHVAIRMSYEIRASRPARSFFCGISSGRLVDRRDTQSHLSVERGVINYDRL
jgi:hypothetical protein